MCKFKSNCQPTSQALPSSPLPPFSPLSFPSFLLSFPFFHFTPFLFLFSFPKLCAYWVWGKNDRRSQIPVDIGRRQELCLFLISHRLQTHKRQILQFRIPFEKTPPFALHYSLTSIHTYIHWHSKLILPRLLTARNINVGTSVTKPGQIKQEAWEGFLKFT